MSAPVRRRDFITLLGGAAIASPLAARAQQSTGRRVGVLMNGAATESGPQSRLASLVAGLRQLGWVEGDNLQLDVRWNAGDAQLARIYSAQLIGLRPDVIFSASTTNLLVLRQATNTVPIVFVQVSDPVAQGFVSSLTRPGGNLTGFAGFEFSIGGKWLSLLKEAAPNLARVGILFSPDTSPQSKFFLRAIRSAAATLGVEDQALPARTTTEIETAIESLAKQPHGGLILPTDAFIRQHGQFISDLALQHRLPAISAHVEFPSEGGLMHYGVVGHRADIYRLAAGYVDRILRGARPGELPIQLPDKYLLVLNLRTAKTLGLAIPLPLIGTADEVIE